MKKKVLVIFGGKSGEHAVSVMSAKSVEQYIDRELFEPLFLGITEQGKWSFGTSIAEITDGKKVIPPKQIVHLPSPEQELSLDIIESSKSVEHVTFDVVFPVIHGTNGEDGRLQGFLDMANLPYVGSGVLGSALAMDKVVQKSICAQAGIPITPFVWFSRKEWQKNEQHVIQKIQAILQFPVFVKPVNLGSSVGITKISSIAELNRGIEEALRYDNKIIVEQAVNQIKEIEIGVLGNDEPKTSVCAEIIPLTEFYDYETKYMTNDIESHVPAEIPRDISEKISQLAIQTFTLLNCRGLARADFFYQPASGNVFLNEINTMPGFTHISMYPKMWEASGLSYTDLITRLIDLGKEEWDAKQQLTYTFASA